MFASVEGARIFFDVEGPLLRAADDGYLEALTLLCLHGGPGIDHTVFKPFLSPLAERTQVVYLDHRGHGRSDRGSSDEWNLVTWGGDVKRFCEALGIDRPIVFGHSFGAAVALSYATQHPEHPGGLVLSGSVGRIDTAAVAHAFGELGGPDAAEAALTHFTEPTSTEAERRFDEICILLLAATFDDDDGVIVNGDEDGVSSPFTMSPNRVWARRSRHIGSA